MTCSSTFFKYSLAVLTQTPATYILMYCNAISTTFTPVRCFQLRKKVLRLDATLYQSSDTTVQHLCYKMSTSGSFAKSSHLTQGGQTTMMSMPVNRITSQCKIKLSQNYCPWITLQLWNFCHSFLQWMSSFFLIIMFCSAIDVYTDRFVRTGGSFYLIVIYFWNSKKISQPNFEWPAPTIFRKFLRNIYYINKSRYQKFQ